MDGPKSMMVLKDIESHFGKDIIKLDAEVMIYYFFIIKFDDVSGCGWNREAESIKKKWIVNMRNLSWNII